MSCGASQNIHFNDQQVKVYMGDGWRLDFSQTHFDTYSPPDFYTKVTDTQKFPAFI